MELYDLKPAKGSNKERFRKGRGHGSGNGKTAGKGHKGQLARSGAKKPGFEGGQMPLYRRIPKRGFTNRNSREIVSINVNELERFEDGAEVTAESLLGCGAIRQIKDGVKILGDGELTKKLHVKANIVTHPKRSEKATKNRKSKKSGKRRYPKNCLTVSESAKAKIEAVGGSVEVVGC